MKQESDHSWLVIKALEERAGRAEATLREIHQIATSAVSEPTPVISKLRNIAHLSRSTAEGEKK